jgi:streptogramin lyase
LALSKTTYAITVGEMPITPIGTISGVDSGLAADYSGNIWFVKTGVEEIIGRITPSGDISSFILPAYGDLSGGITVGPNGNIWYTKEFAGGVIGRIEPDGTVMEFPAEMEYPRRITTGPDGCLWVSGHHNDGRKYIARMTIDGDITLFVLDLTTGFPVGITAGPDGNIWFAVNGANKIGRITLAGKVTFFTTGSSSFDITTGPDENLWFTEYDKIGRITPAGVYTSFQIPTAGSYTYGIASGPNGQIWFTDQGNNAVGHISTDGVYSPLIATPSAISAPQHITLSPNGLLWFTYSNYNKIGLISESRISDYFPLNDGFSWTYQVNGSVLSTRTVSPGTFAVNNVATKRIQESDGYQTYYTNDANGICEHKEYNPEPPVLNMTLSPPFIFADSNTSIGIPLYSSGTASGSLGTESFTLPYAGNSTIAGIENIEVPAGIFQSVKIEVTLSLGGVSSTQTVWIAKNLGTIKSIDDTDNYFLESTNIIDTNPDPFWFPSQYGIENNTFVLSAPAVITGITAPTTISVSGGQYSVDGSLFTTSSGTVTNGQSVTLRVLSAKAASSKSTAQLFIGSGVAEFQVFTSGRSSNIVPILPLLLF